MSIVHMSVFGGVLILVVLGVRKLMLNRVPKQVFVGLWFLCVLRLIIPLSLPSGFSVYSALDSATEQMASSSDQTTTPLFNQLRGFIHSGSTPIESAQKIEQVGRTLSPWTIVWGLGAGSLAAFFIVIYIRSKKRFLGAAVETTPFLTAIVERADLRRQVKLARARVNSPLTYGIFRPVILLPENAAKDNELEYVLTHELVHIRRFDGVKKLLLIITLCLHWFNPLVWLLYTYANRDIELACDEAVLSILGGDIRCNYANTLISYAEVKKTSVFLSFGQHPIEERIKTIMKYKKKTLIGSAAGLAVVVLAAVIFGTNVSSATANETTPASQVEDKELTAGNGGTNNNETNIAETNITEINNTEINNTVTDNTAKRPGWNDNLAFTEEVIKAADIPQEDLTAINNLLEASNTLSAVKLREQFAKEEETGRLFESASKLIQAEYDFYSINDPGLSPAGLILQILINEHYTDQMEVPGQYSCGYTYVTDEVGDNGDDAPSNYFLSYIVQYNLDYTYKDEDSVTLYQVAQLASDFTGRVFAYTEPLLETGMTEAELRKAFDEIEMKSKLYEILEDINSANDHVEFTLSNVNINISGWGSWD